jgi:hypothetical protein
MRFTLPGEMFLAESPNERLAVDNDLSKEQFHELVNIIQTEPFADKLEEFCHTNLVQHHIDTGDAKPVRRKPYRETPSKKEFIKSKTEEPLVLNIIGPPNSAWASLVVIPYAKQESWQKEREMRFCVDTRALNEVTKRDAYPIPRIDEILDALRSASWYTILDLKGGFWHVELAPEAYVPLEASPESAKKKPILP